MYDVHIIVVAVGVIVFAVVVFGIAVFVVVIIKLPISNYVDFEFEN